MKLTSVLLLGLLLISSARAADLTARDGTVYHNYRAISHDAGFLTILCDEGGGRIPLVNLPDDLQKQYGYDPAKATEFVRQFNEIDHQQRMAVQQSQTSLVPAMAPTVAVNVAQNTPGPTTAPAETETTDSDETATADFDPGYDPLAKDATSEDTTREDVSSGVAYILDYDPAGAIVIGTLDNDGRIHWRHYHRPKFDPRDEHRRFRGHDEIPDGATLIGDSDGRWWVSYVDGQKEVHRFDFPPAMDLHIGQGYWTFARDSDGSRVIRRMGGIQPSDHPHHFMGYYAGGVPTEYGNSHSGYYANGRSFYGNSPVNAYSYYPRFTGQATTYFRTWSEPNHFSQFPGYNRSPGSNQYPGSNGNTQRPVVTSGTTGTTRTSGPTVVRGYPSSGGAQGGTVPGTVNVPQH